MNTVRKIKSSAAVEAIKLETQTQAFMDAVIAAGGKPLYMMTPDEARAVFEGVQNVDVKKLDADIEDLVWPVGPTGSVDIRIVRPPNVKDALPVVMYFHGGGWMLGSKNTHDRLIREIAIGAQAAVVFVDYARTPDVKFPVPLEQGYAALEYVVEHAHELNLDAGRVAVAGDSAGGNMATVLTLLAKERKGPQINLQVLFYPVTDNVSDNSSYTSFGNGPWLTKNAMHWFGAAYLPENVESERHVFPLRATTEQLRGLPETVIMTAGNDLLRDEGEAYAEKLNDAGVRVTVTRYNNTIHDFVLLNALAETPAVKAAVAQANQALRHAFSK